MTGSRRRWAGPAGLALLLAGCGDKPPPPPPPPTVTTITVAAHPVDTIIELPGRVQAVRTAEVRARVDGIIERRLYEEGTDVRAGQPLFRIDPREQRAATQSAQATLARAQAAATNARQVVGRYQPLVKEQAISKQEYDAAVAQSRGGQADVDSARAALDRARLNLAYTTVTAPIAGRAGRAQVTEGALVSASQATLTTTIEQVDPIYVNFSQSSSKLLEARRDMTAGRILSPATNRMSVTLVLEDGTVFPVIGRLNFLDLAVDENTGTVSIRAIFPNPGRVLLPGQFVRARINIGTRPNALGVPQRAVMVTGTGASVMLVGRDGKAQPRPVKLGDLRAGEWVIDGGLKPGDRVIVDGLQKVQPGMAVTVAKGRGR